MIPTVNAPVSPISIIVPTYREAGNIATLVRRIFDTMLSHAIDAELLIVDDDSNDGTEEIVHGLATEFPVRLIVRKDERGLSSAVLDGFSRATHSIFVVLDADLQHAPKDIPALVAPFADPDTEFVMGSRYAPGGRISETWSLGRRCNSALATWLARPLLDVSDAMSGFFALRRATWERAGRVNAIGYKIGLELAVRARCRNCVEVPITFSVRHAGTSKLSWRHRVQYLQQLVGLYRFRWTGC